MDQSNKQGSKQGWGLLLFLVRDRQIAERATNLCVLVGLHLDKHSETTSCQLPEDYDHGDDEDQTETKHKQKKRGNQERAKSSRDWCHTRQREITGRTKKEKEGEQAHTL